MATTLVPRPQHSAPPFVAEDLPCLGSGKSPEDLPSRAIGARRPRARAIAEGVKRVDPIASVTLARPEAGFDLGRVQPAPVLGRVMEGKPLPQGRSPDRAQDADDGPR